MWILRLLTKIVSMTKLITHTKIWISLTCKEGGSLLISKIKFIKLQLLVSSHLAEARFAVHFNDQKLHSDFAASTKFVLHLLSELPRYDSRYRRCCGIKRGRSARGPRYSSPRTLLTILELLRARNVVTWTNWTLKPSISRPLWFSTSAQSGTNAG